MKITSENDGRRDISGRRLGVPSPPPPPPPPPAVLNPRGRVLIPRQSERRARAEGNAGVVDPGRWGSSARERKTTDHRDSVLDPEDLLLLLLLRLVLSLPRTPAKSIQFFGRENFSFLSLTSLAFLFSFTVRVISLGCAVMPLHHETEPR